jgi:DNA (cytosine-5)-methyltransferase 1
MTHGSLFSGIGGFDLAAEWMGWENLFHCEWNEFGQKVLHHYWPKAIQYNDITKTDFTIHRGKIDILTGGFPCQPYSSAGKRKGKEDERHLWPEMLRAIREIQPRWVVGENVLGLVNWSRGLVFHEVQADLEASGYEVWPYVLPAVSVNAPHRRDRVWFVAYASSNGYKNGHKETGREKRSSEQRGLQQFERMGGEQFTPYPNGNSTGTSEEGTSTTGSRSNINVQQGERGSKTELNNRPFAVSRDVTHPHSNGFNQRNGNDEEQPGKGGFNALSNADTGDEYGNVADTNNGFDKTLGQRSVLEEQKRQGQTTRLSNGSSQPGWLQFPTQSPICTGDDGLSYQLDGITFSKWRNESIKAAGNAIVPQVVYQIFKAIEQYETPPPLETPL